MMSEKTLFLAWQDKGLSRRWFPVARLDVDVEHPRYRFRYICGATRARKEAGFLPLLEFPKLSQDYRSVELFPLFSNRVISSKRSDRIEYLQDLDLPEHANPVEILSVSGGLRETDHYEVFPKLVKLPDGSFKTRFFLHGWRHLKRLAQDRIEKLEKGEQLFVALELTNPDTTLAVQILTSDYVMLGWAPRYLIHELVPSMVDSPDEIRANVVRLNPLPSPSKQRLLIEIHGKWRGHEPMSHGDFEPLSSNGKSIRP